MSTRHGFAIQTSVLEYNTHKSECAAFALPRGSGLSGAREREEIKGDSREKRDERDAGEQEIRKIRERERGRGSSEK